MTTSTLSSARSVLFGDQLTGMRRAYAATLLFAALAIPLNVHAQTLLADSPLFSTSNVPGNLVLPLSVEFPTAVGNAHPDNTYASTSEYLGYFDPNKCYVYTFVDVESSSLMTHFAPRGAASAHACNGTNSYMWSGNYLNWATMQTIDPFRWALTGGYRVVDIPSLTLLEKAWASGQGGTSNFPDRVMTNTTDIANSTPFGSTTGVTVYVQGKGQMAKIVPANGNGGMLGTYFNTTDLDASGATPVLTRTENVNFDWGNGSPDAKVNSDNFSARWTSLGTVPTTGTYTFQTVSDDGVRLYVNGTLLIDNWTDHAPATDTKTMQLTAGGPLNVRLEYYERTGGAKIQLFWQPPGAGALTTYTGNPDNAWYAPIRVKVCDNSTAAGGLESNCTAYANGNYKPEGLMQQYSNRIRYGVFGYLNDGNISRDGGVLRAQQKFVGPTYPVPGSADQSNSSAQEWDPNTGVFVVNPDASDAAQTATDFNTPITNSGVLNYLNKFGEFSGSYKTYDPVSELYYAALRYYKNLGNVSTWTDMTGASAGTRKAWADGFPVITRWKDPIQYSCQKNFILGIGDVNTHADKNVAGNTDSTQEPAMPAEVTADTTVNAITATNQVGLMQGLGTNFASKRNYPSCCNNNAPYIAGLAYDANTRDIRPDIPNPTGSIGQTVQTFWVDVLEGGYKANNQYYLAAKFGGAKVPASGFDPYSPTAALQTSWWNTNTDKVGGQPRPDNYFTAGRPDLMVSGLKQAFASIAASLKAYTTSFAPPLPQVAQLGNASYFSQFDASTWTGEVKGGTLTFDATTGAPTTNANWTFTTQLAAQIAGTATPRRILTWNGSSGVAFRAAPPTGATTSIASADLAKLATNYVTSNVADYVDYLRGDATNEVGSTVSGSKKAYRARAKPLGDIVGSRVQPVGAPSFPFSDATNAGYASFKTTWKNRRTVVYVGANDGMLHAINGALEAASTATPPLESDPNFGREMFAYVPRALFQGATAPNTDGLAALGNPNFTHHYMVNATPSVADIDFKKTYGVNAAGSSEWHSVLIGGLGKGGKAYYAIDVTDPVSMATSAGGEDFAAGKVLWEFTAPELGYSFGDPMVMKTKKYGWVVVFTSGYNNTDGKGYFLFVNPVNGALLEKVSTGVGSTSSDAGLARANAFIVDATDGTADAIYGGDLLGNLWRLDVTSTTGTYSDTGKLVKLATLTDAGGAAQPVTTRPSIEVHPTTKKRFVMVGTGRLLDTTDIPSKQVQSFYAIVDGTNAAFNAKPFPSPSTTTFPVTRSLLQANTDSSDSVSFDPATQAGWYEDLGVDPGTPAVPASGTTPASPSVPSTGIAFRVIADSTTLLGSVAFSTNLPNGDICNPSGKSRVYARDYASTLSTVQSYVSSVLTSVPYISLDGNITDLRYLSVNGKSALISGTDTGAVSKIETPPLKGFSLRRINWRELQVVD